MHLNFDEVKVLLFFNSQNNLCEGDKNVWQNANYK